jgi:hypothetical protein
VTTRIRGRLSVGLDDRWTNSQRDGGRCSSPKLSLRARSAGAASYEAHELASLLPSRRLRFATSHGTGQTSEQEAAGAVGAAYPMGSALAQRERPSAGAAAPVRTVGLVRSASAALRHWGNSTNAHRRSAPRVSITARRAIGGSFRMHWRSERGRHLHQAAFRCTCNATGIGPPTSGNSRSSLSRRVCSSGPCSVQPKAGVSINTVNTPATPDQPGRWCPARRYANRSALRQRRSTVAAPGSRVGPQRRTGE